MIPQKNLQITFSNNSLHAKYFHNKLIENNINFATGVPCGVQRDIIKYLQSDSSILHISATNESEAVGIATGAYLAGSKPLVYMQNSGLFRASNDIASLAFAYKIPILLTISWRGCFGEDAVQHLVTGKATPSLLESIGIPWANIDKNNIDEVTSIAFNTMKESKLPFAILFKRGWDR